VLPDLTRHLDKIAWQAAVKKLETVDLVRTVASLTFPCRILTPVRLGTKNQNMRLRPIINLDRAKFTLDSLVAVVEGCKCVISRRTNQQQHVPRAISKADRVPRPCRNKWHWRPCPRPGSFYRCVASHELVHISLLKWAKTLGPRRSGFGSISPQPHKHRHQQFVWA
jgi:hypothetical protein